MGDVTKLQLIEKYFPKLGIGGAALGRPGRNADVQLFIGSAEATRAPRDRELDRDRADRAFRRVFG